MAILSALLSVSEPSNSFWIIIIKAFEAVTNNYVLAIIFLTVVLRIIWSVFDTFGKYSQRKMTIMQQKMQPELEKLKVKYANSPQLLSQKQNELSRKYMDRSYYVGCFITLIVMIFNMVIFFTLFAGLNTMSSYKISANYDNLKTTYANCLNVVDKYFNSIYQQDNEKNEIFKNYQNLNFIIRNEEDGKTYIYLTQKVETEDTDNIIIEGENKYKIIEKQEYILDFSSKETEMVDGEETEVVVTANENILKIINRIFPTYNEGEEEGSKEIILTSSPAIDENGNEVVDENGQPVYNKLYLSDAIQNIAMAEIYNEYEKTKDSFLWIENIWIADSPSSQSILSYNSLKSYLGKYATDGEEEIYNSFMIDLKETKGRANGYYILPLLIVLVSVASILLNNLYSKRKAKKEGKPVFNNNVGKWMQVVIPVLLGLFALFYNSVFAIYMLTGQIIASLLNPIQNLILDKILDKKEKKKQQEVVVEYTRKF